MAINNSVLGMNARNFLYIRPFNGRKAKAIADNKLLTKKLLIKHGIPTSKLLGVFIDRNSIRQFDWSALPGHGFAIKPARGFMGEGILVFKNWTGTQGETYSGEKFDIEQLESHLLDIFEGAYSLQSLPDQAFVEEKVSAHQFFKKLIPFGLPDIRVIVFQKVPVMAMMRLPTTDSRGKANLHLGALGVGIDLKTGITTTGIQYGQPIDTMPGTKIKVRGIKLPFWEQLLKVAVQTQIASKLGYAGIDLVIDDTGVKVLEINSRPGLGIQVANMSSLRPRLERVADLGVESIDRGIEIAKNLFAQKFADKVDVAPKIISFIEKISIKTNNGSFEVEAKIDSGAFRSSIDKKLAERLALPIIDKKVFVKSASGIGYREVVKLEFVLSGKKISTIASVAARSHLKFPVIIGRLDLKGFLIDPTQGEFEDDELKN